MDGDDSLDLFRIDPDPPLNVVSVLEKEAVVSKSASRGNMRAETFRCHCGKEFTGFVTDKHNCIMT